MRIIEKGIDGGDVFMAFTIDDVFRSAKALSGRGYFKDFSSLYCAPNGNKFTVYGVLSRELWGDAPDVEIYDVFPGEPASTFAVYRGEKLVAIARGRKELAEIVIDLDDIDGICIEKTPSILSRSGLRAGKPKIWLTHVADDGDILEHRVVADPLKMLSLVGGSDLRLVYDETFYRVTRTGAGTELYGFPFEVDHRGVGDKVWCVVAEVDRIHSCHTTQEAAAEMVSSLDEDLLPRIVEYTVC
jgi:hypothetical protein